MFDDTGCAAARKHGKGTRCLECGFGFCVMDVPLETQLRLEVLGKVKPLYDSNVSVRKAAHILGLKPRMVDKYYKSLRNG